MSSNNIVKLDIGGTIFKTSKSTLTKFDGMLRTMLETGVPVAKDESGCIFIDRDPSHFPKILNFMRDGRVELPDSVKELKEIQNEAQYYLLSGLVELCNAKIPQNTEETSNDTRSSQAGNRAPNNRRLISHGYEDMEINESVDNLEVGIHGSGDIRINALVGNLEGIIQGSGNILINAPVGNLRMINHASGDIRINGTVVNLEVVNNGSGDIQIKKSVAKLHVVNNGSGDILITASVINRLNRNSENFHVVNRGSGSIRWIDR